MLTMIQFILCGSRFLANYLHVLYTLHSARYLRYLDTYFWIRKLFQPLIQSSVGLYMEYKYNIVSCFKPNIISYSTMAQVQGNLWRQWSLRLVYVVFSFHFLLTTSFTHAHSTRLPHSAIPTTSPTSLTAELKVQIQGSKNAFTTIRSGDVVSYHLSEPTVDGKTIRLGVLSQEGEILPLATLENGAAEFKVDLSASPLNANRLKQEGRIGRFYSSDKRGDTFIIDEYLDNEIYFPLFSSSCQNNSSCTSIFDIDIALMEKQLEIAKLEAQLLQLRKQMQNQADTGLNTQSTKVVLSERAPQPIGPYSQAVLLNNQLYVSGCIGIDPATGKLVDGGIEVQTLRSLANLEAILSAGGSSTDRIAKTTIYVTDLAQYSTVNKLYAEFLQKAASAGHKIVLPARTTVEVSALPLGALVEIDAIAGTKSST